MGLIFANFVGAIGWVFSPYYVDAALLLLPGVVVWLTYAASSTAINDWTN